MAADREGFDRSVPLPAELKIAHIRKAIDYIERETSELIEVYFEQANLPTVCLKGIGRCARLSPEPSKSRRSYRP